MSPTATSKWLNLTCRCKTIDLIVCRTRWGINSHFSTLMGLKRLLSRVRARCCVLLCLFCWCVSRHLDRSLSTFCLQNYSDCDLFVTLTAEWKQLCCILTSILDKLTHFTVAARQWTEWCGVRNQTGVKGSSLFQIVHKGSGSLLQAPYIPSCRGEGQVYLCVSLYIWL